VSRETVLVIVNRAGDAFTTTVAVKPVSGTATSTATINAVTPTTTVAMLQGRVVTDELWRIRLTVGLAGTTFGYVVEADDTLADIAAELAGAINATGPADYIATSDGEILVITSVDGADFTTTLRRFLAASTDGIVDPEIVDPTTTVATLFGVPVQNELWTIAITITIDEIPQTQTLHEYRIGLAAALTITGTPEHGDVWTLVLNDDENTTFSLTLDVATFVAIDTDGEPGVSEAELAAALAAAINAYTPGTVDFVAMSAGPTLEVSSKTEPVSLTLAVNGEFVAAVEGELDSLAEVAAALAADINATADEAFTATSDAESVIIVNREGADFTTAFALTLADGNPAGAMVIDDHTATIRRINLSGTPAAGDTWTATVAGSDYSLPELDAAAITAFDTDGTAGLSAAEITAALGEIAADLAEAVNAGAPDQYTATSDGDVLFIVNRNGDVFEAEVAVTTTATPAIPADATATVVTLSGMVFNNDVWTIRINDSDDTTYSFRVGESGTVVTLLGSPETGETWTIRRCGYRRRRAGRDCRGTGGTHRSDDRDASRPGRRG
jgi:hypothetical protein